MDKKIRIGILIGFIIICLDVLILGNDSVDEAQSRRDILADNSVIDLGNHIIAYRTSSDILDISYKGSYLAIDDLDSGKTLYLPDIYEEVYKMELEDDGSIFISYKDMIHNRIQAASIPVRFPTRDNPLYEITEIQRKILTEAQGNISKAAEELPKLIWSEKVSCESGTYEITFERTSCAYKSPDGKEELFADYCLTFKDGDDNILVEQAMINYPIEYEDVYWVRDFSGDGLPDIAFYTGIFQSDGTDLEFIMSNAETKAYEAVRLPIRLSKTQMPVWNEEQSAVILYEMLYQNVTMKMYSFHDMRWELVDELLPMYEEDEGSIWARNNKEDVKLYPEIYSEGEWETIEVTIGEDTITKYVRKEAVKTNEGSIFSDSNIVYLGGYMKAYLMDASMDVQLLRGYEGEWIVINDAEEGKNIYLRNEFSKILDIRIEDFSAVYIKYENSEEAGVQELTVPLCFSWKKEDVLELYPNVKRVVVEPPTAALRLPETVWEESITYKGASYLAAFERISPAYFGSECYGKHADYQLVVKDENGNTIASRIITGYPIAMEEVYWLKDISGDGFPDVILCSFCEQNKRVGYDTDLHFFVWNKEKLMYESKPLADYMYDPFWSEELSSIIFFCLDDYAYMRYTFRDGEWQLSGKLAEDLREAHDENSPWCKRNVQNENLMPRSTDWDSEDKELEGGERAWKFVREADKRSNAYFYAEGETAHTYEGYFYLHSYTELWQDVDLYITELEHFSGGTLYALELEQTESTDPLEQLLDRKYIGYFYVTDEIIYYITARGDGYTEENNNVIISQIKSDEADFLERCTIVCCEEGTEDITDENGYHAYVEVDGDRRIFRFYNDYFYGSKDYILMVWEKGQGLTYYVHGNGSMNMHVEFGHNIKEEQKADYGYPYKRFH